MKRKLLIVGITMNAAGSERSFLEFAENIDYSEWDVTLLLAKAAGEFMHLVPKQINVKEMDGGEIFLIDRSNAKKIIFNNYIKKNPLRVFPLGVSVLEILFSRGRKRTYAKNRLWLKVMKTMPKFTGEYDAAIAYWGDRTMFYTADKVNAKRKITWLHFDFNEPPREKKLYEKYFLKFDKVVTVSKRIEQTLVDEIPSISNIVMTVENFINEKKIRRLSEEECLLDGEKEAIKLLTVGRICEQKGYDMAMPAVKRLLDEGYNIKWYIIGQGEGEYYETLKRKVSADGALVKKVIFLGTTDNPYKYMRASDIYFQPSRHEGKPIAVEEAKILCKPIVVTAFTSAEEQLRSCALGAIVEISEDGIYGGLKTLIDDAEKRNLLVKTLNDEKAYTENSETVRNILT
ncbi:MAG: glycosyltransferase [Clostridia bacterium]|nr:glycosyltransferase [Clostridia bacterium]